MPKRAESYFKKARLLTGATWVARAARAAGRWSIDVADGLPNSIFATLAEGLNVGARGKIGGVKLLPRHRKLRQDTRLGVENLYIVPVNASEILVIGGRLLGKQQLGLWELVAAVLAAKVGLSPQSRPKPRARRAEARQAGKPDAAERGLSGRQADESLPALRVAQEEAARSLLAQREAERRLLHAAKLAAVGEMVAGIAHELNNPLTTVAGFAELIIDEIPADAKYRPDVEMVIKESQRARTVVRRLLDFARQGERARARSDINEILEDVLALTTHLIHTSGVQLETRFAQDLPWVLVDANEMQQVFLNLIHNALQAMPVGGRLLIQSGLRERDGRSWLVVDVVDNGLGIDPNDIERIFEPFFTTRGSRGGTGLGLSVTYGIVTEHGGSIEVESRQGAGASFAVWLPV